MIEICFCDDEEQEHMVLKKLAGEFLSEHTGLLLRFHYFDSPAVLLDFIEKNGGFDLYILDVLMPGMSGIELAGQIRSRCKAAEIIFLTVSREYAVEAFGVKASGYLLKPVCKADFDEVLLSCIRQRLASQENAALTLKTKDGLRRICLRDLVLVESFDHTRVLTLSDDTVLETVVTLSELFNQLREYPQFCMPHRAYIVNMDYADGLRKNELLMSGSRRIPISRKEYGKMKKLFLDYFFSP